MTERPLVQAAAAISLVAVGRRIGVRTEAIEEAPDCSESYRRLTAARTHAKAMRHLSSFRPGVANYLVQLGTS